MEGTIPRTREGRKPFKPQTVLLAPQAALWERDYSPPGGGLSSPEGFRGEELTLDTNMEEAAKRHLASTSHRFVFVGTEAAPFHPQLSTGGA